MVGEILSVDDQVSISPTPAKKLDHFKIKKGIYYTYKKGLAFYVCKEWLVTLVEQMLESLDVFEDAPKYYSKLVEKITVTQIIEDDERIQVRKSNKWIYSAFSNFRD